ncbi:transcriptional regulator [Weissella oryzae SG25]|uniref:Transcriptional regulator n=1 Tax=Weissella oryzae (strain DSM 25784 / JCM 18191 / LMG 30913 / SG25) TaxID=1329250 RepID=A0A069CUE1_WEIOS|nr:MarR family transcriptional regulator [Weissella oryzae]GAK30818.1 transcriptional regulator [Weissella oryzae SG25]
MNYFYLSKFIAGIYRQTKNDFNKEISGLNVRATESDLLLFITEHPNLSQQELSVQMVLDKSLLAKNLKILQKKELIKRCSDSSDGRIHKIVATDAGQETAIHLKMVMNEWWEKIFKDNTELDPQIFYQQLELGYNLITQTKIQN